MKSSTKQSSSSKPKFGYWAGAVDLIHYGHIRAIKYCAYKCENLIVGLMTDASIFRYKEHLPIMRYEERKEVLESIRWVAHVIPQDDFEYGHSVMSIKSFWKEDFIIFDSEEHKREGADVIVPRTQGISSTNIKRRVYENLIYL